MTPSPFIQPVLYGLLALALCTLLHFFALKLFPKLGLLDHPERYGLARGRLPYPTGIAAVISFLAMFAATRTEWTLQEAGLTAAILLLAITTLFDDLRTLPPILRLTVQGMIGFLLFATGTRIYTITNPLGGILPLDTVDLPYQFSILHFPFFISNGPLPLWSGVFTVLWIVLTTNAANWLDGVPGQVSVLTALSALTLGLLSMSSRVSQPEIALIAFLLCGVALASAIFDLPRASVLGDTGAMFFGLLLGALSIYAGGKVATVLLAFGVPVLDAFFVIIDRMMKGTSPFKGRNDHLHHLLLARGWSEGSVIALTVLLGALFGITALFLSTAEKFLALLLFTALIFALRIFARKTPSVSR